MKIQVFKTENGGRRDLSELVTEVTWSGDYKSAVREMSFSYVQAPDAWDIPAVAIAPGDVMTLDVDGKTIFAGMVVHRSMTDDTGIIKVRCQDRGRQIKINKATYQFAKTSPEAAVAKIAADFGIETGDVADTGIALTRNFVATSLYDIILTMYSLAAEQNGKKYIVRFDLGKLCVREKVKPADPVRIAARVNLQSLSFTESVDELVNRVQIVDDSYKVVATEEDADSIAKFGLAQSQIKQSDAAAQAAKAAIAEGGEQQTITVQNLGDIRAVTGTVVELRETFTGLVGEFYVDSDLHSWKRGQYFNKLTLNFKNLMDSKSSGSED